MEQSMPNPSVRSDWGAALRTPLALGLSALLAVQIGAALVLDWSARGTLTPAAADRPLLAFDPQSVEVLRIDGKTDTGQAAIALTRSGQDWVLKDLGDFPADGTKIEALLNKLADLKRPLPVATSAESLKRHKVADDEYERRVVLESGGKPVVALLLGDSPGFRRQLARPAGESAVYDLDLALHDVGNRPDDWLAKDRLQIDQQSVEGIAAKDWELIKSKEGWRFAESGAPTDKAPDPAAVVNLLGRLGNLSYRGVLGVEDKPDYNQSNPVMELKLKLKDGSNRSYRISKPKEGQDYVLKPSDRPWYFKVADFDLEGILDQDKAKLSGEPAQPPVASKPTEKAPTSSPAGADESAATTPADSAEPESLETEEPADSGSASAPPPAPLSEPK